MSRPEEGWGQDEWADDDKVRTISGQQYEPWKTWDLCSGPWKFPNGLMQFLKDAGFKCPTPIQSHVWPVLLDGKDVIGVAKTGSGKTLAFLLPGYIKVKRAEMTQDGPKLNCDHANGPAMLVVAPTRELCQQIFEESERFGQPAQIKTACVYGGASRQPQQRSLWSGPHCVVATPGRLKDFLEDRSINLHQNFYIILDEADRMLDMGFAPAIKELVGYLPEVKQVGLFTATWPREIQEIGARFTNNPTHIQVGTSDACTSNADIRQHVHVVHSENDKMAFLENKVFPALQGTNGSALIFLKTKRGAAQLYSTLSRAGAPIVCLHGAFASCRKKTNTLSK
jgi:ATP-dependent RNA helicase DDX5/DBP2